MKKQKDNSLEGLRGIASLVVVIGHFIFVFLPYLATLYYPAAGAAPRNRFEAVLAYPPFSLLFSAEAAVCVFFVMSGYVLTTKYFSTGDVAAVQSAAAKRYVRLALPSFASVALAWCLWRTGAIQTQQAGAIGVAGWVPSWYVGPFSVLSVFVDGLIGAPLFSRTALNPPLWTIQVELIGSILLFSMMALFGRRPLLLAAWFLFFSIVLGFQKPNAMFYLSFLVGALLNPARDWLRRHEALSVVMVALGLVGVAYNEFHAFAALRSVPLPNWTPLGPDFNENPRLVWNSIGAMLLVGGTLGSRHVGAVFAARVPVFLGKISFSMYVVHMPLLMSVGLRASAVFQSFGISYANSAALAFVVYVAAVILVSAVFYRLVDAPSMRLADRVGARLWRVAPAKVEERQAISG